MSVIVKDMEMPTCCEWCEFEKFEQNLDGYIIDSWCPAISNEPSTLKIRRERRHSLCPLRPLPYKHGRLIDADELEDVFYSFHRSQSVGYVQDAETIVEAEGE